MGYRHTKKEHRRQHLKTLAAFLSPSHKHLLKKIPQQNVLALASLGALFILIRTKPVFCSALQSFCWHLARCPKAVSFFFVLLLRDLPFTAFNL